MQIYVAGFNHRTTPVGIRGKLAIGASGLQPAMTQLYEHGIQCIILCTCNRTEIYTIAEKPYESESVILHFFTSRTNLPMSEMRKNIYAYHGEDAVRHLFRVAAGLDSMIIGEYEILGQVKHALKEGGKFGMAGLTLLNLFRHAVRVGRRIRAETAISRNALSVSSVGVEYAMREVDDFCSCKVVVIGAGEAGRLVAKASKDRGVSQIVVVSRAKKKGEALAAALNGRWTSIDNLKQELNDCDIIISCTGAPHLVLKAELLEEIMITRLAHPMVIIDIAVPPDVEWQAKQLDGVFLYNIDDLTKVTETNHEQRQTETHKASKIINEEVNRFGTNWREMEVKPIISALVKKAEDIRNAQFGRTLKKIPNLSDEERTCLEAMSKSIVRKMLHAPIERLKNTNHKTKDYIRVLEELFSLNGKNEDEKKSCHRFQRKSSG